MSTILDALRKSEQERKRSDVPKLSDMPVPQESARWPLYAIAVLSLVLALVLGVLLSQWLSAPNSQHSNAGSNAFVQEEALLNSSRIADQGIAASNNSSAADELVVNVVSYSDSPEQRFVMLNGKMHRENDFVQAGIKVHEIKPSAVVLNIRGELVTRTP